MDETSQSNVLYFSLRTGWPLLFSLFSLFISLSLSPTSLLLLLSSQMAMHFDPNGAIAKSHGKMAGPMAEIKVST